MKKFLASFLAILSAVLLPAAASAHVVVKPDEVGVGAFQTFTTSVPNEKNVPVIALRLVIPSGLKEITPTVKPGWKVTTKKSGDEITEIDWSGGNIPVGMRDDFTFSAQAPAKTTALRWKAYQTYKNGTVVSWNQTPTSGEDDKSGGDKGPYSTTKVINDLDDSATVASANNSGSSTGSYILSGIALALAIVALVVKRKNQS